MKTFTLTSFAAFLGEVAVAMPIVEHHALDRAGQIVETEAKRVLGTYDYSWPPLAAATQDRRSKAGFPPNEPGLVTGEMRDSIGHVVVGHSEVQIGSGSEKLLWFELGTSKQPPRSVLAGALAHKIDEVVAVIGGAVASHIATGEKS